MALLGLNIIHQLFEGVEVHCGGIYDDAIPKVYLGDLKSSPPTLLVPEFQLIGFILLDRLYLTPCHCKSTCPCKTGRAFLSA